MNPLTKMEVLSILMSYQKFLKSYKTDKTDLKITKSNFNQIKCIADKINDRKLIKEYWGDTFDKIYLFLERPEIKIIMEPKKILNLEIRSKEITRPLNEKSIENILNTYKKFLDSCNESIGISDENWLIWV